MPSSSILQSDPDPAALSDRYMPASVASQLRSNTLEEDW
jgi:hypothetical protein